MTALQGQESSEQGACVYIWAFTARRDICQGSCGEGMAEEPGGRTRRELNSLSPAEPQDKTQSKHWTVHHTSIDGSDTICKGPE